MEKRIGTVGVTDYAQVSLLKSFRCCRVCILTADIHVLYFLVSFKSKLGDIVYVQLPDVGDKVTEGGKKQETVCDLTEQVTETCLSYKFMFSMQPTLYLGTFKLQIA